MGVEVKEERLLGGACPISDAIPVCADCGGLQAAPDLVLWGEGSQAVLWHSTSDAGEQLWARLVDDCGVPTGMPVLLASSIEGELSAPTVCQSPDASVGRYLVWIQVEKQVSSLNVMKITALDEIVTADEMSYVIEPALPKASSIHAISLHGERCLVVWRAPGEGGGGSPPASAGMTGYATLFHEGIPLFHGSILWGDDLSVPVYNPVFVRVDEATVAQAWRGLPAGQGTFSMNLRHLDILDSGVAEGPTSQLWAGGQDWADGVPDFIAGIGLGEGGLMALAAMDVSSPGGVGVTPIGQVRLFQVDGNSQASAVLASEVLYSCGSTCPEVALTTSAGQGLMAVSAGAGSAPNEGVTVQHVRFDGNVGSVLAHAQLFDGPSSQVSVAALMGSERYLAAWIVVGGEDDGRVLSKTWNGAPK